MYVVRNLHHLLDCVRLQQIVIVEMIKQNVNSLGHVINLRLEGWGCHGLDSRDLGRQEIYNGLCSGRDV